jgi:hypothetical protein
MNDIVSEVFGKKGYSTKLQLSQDEVNSIRELISEHWLEAISTHHPDLTEDAKNLGIQNYHLLSTRLDHGRLWSKSNRVLPQNSVDSIKHLSFFGKLKEIFGNFHISDVYDTIQHHGKEEIYWRLVRPNESNDVGPLHIDKWFHELTNNGQGMFSPNVTTIKIWIPLYCEPGKNGLLIVESSHQKTWGHHLKKTESGDKPVLDDDPSKVNATLIPTEPGNTIIFNENILHGGSLNKGQQTRVSLEITLVLSDHK